MNNKKSNNTIKKKRSKKGKKLGASIGLSLKVLLLTFLLAFVAFFSVFYMKYGKIILKMQRDAKKCVWNSNLDTFKEHQTSLFFDANGTLISSLSGEKEVYYIRYDDIPKNIIDAMVTIEDKRYFEHEGIDFFANIRAAIALIKNEGRITQGGSTITQQLARNIFLSNEVTLERKLKELFIASELEKKYSKEKILEFYLNNIYFANGFYGIQAASMGYFNKSVSKLTLSQGAFLCAIPNNPTIYNPKGNKKNTYQRRNRILQQMFEDEVITKKQYESAIKEKIKINIQKEEIYNYVESYVYHATIEALMAREGFVFRNHFEDVKDKEAYNETYKEKYQAYKRSLYTKGYRVYTSIDFEKQRLLQESLDKNLSAYPETSNDGTYQLQGSAVCISNDTGRVVAIVGGRSQTKEGYTLNRAYQSYRQPGSAIKPLLVYTPYMETGHNPDEIVVDKPIEGGPKNANLSYAGEMSLRRAIELSKNTIAWKALEELTPSVGLDYLYKMKFKGLDPKDNVLATSLGGFTYGTNTLEMASAFLAMEHGGVFRNPTCIVEIRDADGQLVYGGDDEGIQVYDVNCARVMTDVLTGVLTRGTGKNLRLQNSVAAGKTGTTSKKKDGWFVGYTKYYTTSVWVGYDTPRTMQNLYGNTYPGYIWRDYMNAIHKGLEPKEFVPYKDTWTLEEELEEENSLISEFEEELGVAKDEEEIPFEDDIEEILEEEEKTWSEDELEQEMIDQESLADESDEESDVSNEEEMVPNEGNEYEEETYTADDESTPTSDGETNEAKKETAKDE